MKPFAFIPGESFNGAVARWADEVGGLERMIDLTGFAGVRYGHVQRAASADEADIRALAAEMEVEPNELLKRSIPKVSGECTNNHHPVSFFGVTVPTMLIEKRIRAFSPAALAASPHHRALWDVRLIPACTVTGELLLRSCGSPECKPTGWSATLGIDRCEHCMADLASLEAERISEEDRACLAAVGDLFIPDEVARAASLALLPPEIAQLGASDVLDLLTRVAPVVDRHLPTNLAGILAAPPADLCRAVASSWRILIGWPDAMAELAAERVRSRTGKHNDGNGGRTMRFLTRKRHAGASEAVLALIADWRRSLSIDKEEGTALRARSVTGATVSRTTGFETMKVVEHRRQGLLQVHFALDQERPDPRYDAAEIQAIAVAVADRCSMAAARVTLGMALHGVEQLIAMRLLDDLDLAILDAHYGSRQVSRSSLTTLVAEVRAAAGSSAPSASLPLRAAMKAVGGRVKPWGPAVAMLLSGELPFALAAGDLPLSDAILVDASAASMLASLPLRDHVAAKLSPFMSKVDAGELLNLSPRKVTAVLAGYETGAGSHARTIPLEAVLQIARRHITAAEIAARRSVTTACARADAVAAGVLEFGPAGFDRIRAERELL